MERASIETGQTLESSRRPGVSVEACVAITLAVIFSAGTIITLAWEMFSSAASPAEIAMRAAFPRPLITFLLAGGLSVYALLVAWRARYTPATAYFSLWAASAAYVLAWDLYPFMPEADFSIKTAAFLSIYTALLTWPLTFLVFTRHFPRPLSNDEISSSITSLSLRLAKETVPQIPKLEARAERRGLLAFWAAFIGLYFLTFNDWDLELLSGGLSIWLMLFGSVEGLILMFVGRNRAGAAGRSPNPFVASRSPWLLCIGMLSISQVVIYIDGIFNLLPLPVTLGLWAIGGLSALGLALLRIPRTLAVAPSILVAFAVLLGTIAVGLFYLTVMAGELFEAFFMPWVVACVLCGIANFAVGYRKAGPLERRQARWFAAGMLAGLATFAFQMAFTYLPVGDGARAVFQTNFEGTHSYLLVFLACVGVGMFFRGELDPRLLLGNSLAYAMVGMVLLGVFGWLEHDLIHYLALLTPWSAAEAANKVHWLAPAAAGICLHPAKVGSEHAVHWLWKRFRSQPLHEPHGGL